MPLPVFEVKVRGVRGAADLRYVRAESVEAAARLAKDWEVPVLAVRPQPLSAEERVRVGRRPSELAELGQL